MTDSATPTAQQTAVRLVRPVALSAFENAPKIVFEHNRIGPLFRENRPVDQAGEPLPWLNYSLIRLLDERLHDGYEYLSTAAAIRPCTTV